MDGISIENLKQMLKAAIPPLVLSLRSALGKPEEPRVNPGAIMRDADAVADWALDLELAPPIIFCHEQGVARIVSTQGEAHNWPPVIQMGHYENSNVSARLKMWRGGQLGADAYLPRPRLGGRLQKTFGYPGPTSTGKILTERSIPAIISCRAATMKHGQAD